MSTETHPVGAALVKEKVGFGNLLSISHVQAKHNILTKNDSILFKQAFSTEPIIRNEVI